MTEISKLEPTSSTVILAKVKIGAFSSGKAESYIKHLGRSLKEHFPDNKVIVFGDDVEFSTIDLQKNDYAVNNRIIPNAVTFDPSLLLNKFKGDKNA